MKRPPLFIILLSVLALSACAPSKTYQHGYEWPTPMGGYASTPTPSGSLLVTPTPHYKCVSWRDVTKSDAGQQLCVEGVVTQVDNSEEASVVYFVWRFGDQPENFVCVSFEDDLSDLTGKCIRLEGVIEIYKGRPAIIVKDRDQIGTCLGV